MRKLSFKEGVEIFWSKVDKAGVCWVWTGATKVKGYGTNIPMPLKRRFKTGRAHKASLLLNGVKIPSGMCVDHICRNRACVRPDHLRVVTVRVNSTENSLSPPAINKAKTHCSKGHQYTRENTMIRKSGPRKGARVCRACAKIRNARRIWEGRRYVGYGKLMGETE